MARHFFDDAKARRELGYAKHGLAVALHVLVEPHASLGLGQDHL